MGHGRSSMETEVCDRVIAADGNWHRDPYGVSGGAALLTKLGIKPVSSGETDAGRGATGYDLYRSRDMGGVEVLDAIQVKTGKEKKEGSAPSEIMLATGNAATPAIVRAIFELGCRWDVLFVSSLRPATDPTGELCRVLFMDIAEKIRECQDGIKLREDGDTDPMFVKLSARRISGAYPAEVRAHEQKGVPLPPGKSWAKRAHWEFPHSEDAFEFRGNEIPGKVWTAPYAVKYAELIVSLYRLGVTQADWKLVKRSELPSLVAGYNFGYGV